MSLGMRIDYNSYSKGQLQMLQLTVPFIEQALAVHSTPLTDAPIVVADYGASAGSNSSAAMSVIIEGLRYMYGFERTRSILAIHEDVPQNAWTQLFSYIHDDPNSYLKRHKGVHALACGLSFYKQVMPTNFVHFGISMNSAHWVSKIPVKLRRSVTVFGCEPEEYKTWQKLAADDWDDFLKARNAELAPGGVFVANLPAECDVLHALLTSISEAAISMVEDGKMTDQELLDFNIGCFYRKIEHVNDRQQYETHGLELVAAELSSTTQSVLYEEHKDNDCFAEIMAQSLAAADEPYLADALAASGRKASEQKAISNELWQCLKQIIAKKGRETFRNSWTSLSVIFKKRLD